MKIDTSKIEGYNEMSADEKLSALEGFEVEVPEDLSGKVASMKKMIDDYSSQIAEYKKKEKASLDENERAQAEINERLSALETENASLKSEKRIANLKASYIGLGYDDKLADKKAKAYVNGDDDLVAKCEQEYREAFEKAIRADAMKSTPHPDDKGASGGAMTLEKLRKMGPAERHKFSVENPEEYKRLYGGN